MTSNLDSDSFARYVAHVKAIPRLSREEEHELAVRAQNGDRVAAERLVGANLRYVVAIALSYRRYGVRLADLVAEGNLGLMIALRKFDPERGTRFVTYAAHWIRALILEHIIRGFSLVGVGSGPLRSKVFFRLRREKAKLAALGGDASEANERLAAELGTTVAKVEAFGQRLEARDASLDAPGREGGPSLLESLASGDPSQEEGFLVAERATALRMSIADAVVELDARERYIVETRLMADAPEELSLAEIGRKLGVSRERARQLEARAKDKLRKRLRQSEGLADHLSPRKAA